MHVPLPETQRGHDAAPQTGGCEAQAIVTAALDKEDECLWGEKNMVLAAIDQERGLALLDVDLLGKYSEGIRGCLQMAHVQIFGLEKGWMGNDSCTNDIFEREIERKAGYKEQKWAEYRKLPVQPQVGVVPP